MTLTIDTSTTESVEVRTYRYDIVFDQNDPLDSNYYYIEPIQPAEGELFYVDEVRAVNDQSQNTSGDYWFNPRIATQSHDPNVGVTYSSDQLPLLVDYYRYSDRSSGKVWSLDKYLSDGAAIVPIKRASAEGRVVAEVDVRVVR